LILFFLLVVFTQRKFTFQCIKKEFFLVYIKRYFSAMMLALAAYTGCNAMSADFTARALCDLEYNVHAILKVVNLKASLYEDVIVRRNAKLQAHVDNLINLLLILNANKNEYLADVLIALQDPEIRKDTKDLGFIVQDLVQSGEVGKLIPLPASAPFSWKSRVSEILKGAGIALITILLLTAPTLAAAGVSGFSCNNPCECTGKCVCMARSLRNENGVYSCVLQAQEGSGRCSIHSDLTPYVCSASDDEYLGPCGLTARVRPGVGTNLGRPDCEANFKVITDYGTCVCKQAPRDQDSGKGTL
jgi:hypothetical protein